MAWLNWTAVLLALAFASIVCGKPFSIADFNDVEVQIGSAKDNKQPKDLREESRKARADLLTKMRHAKGEYDVINAEIFRQDGGTGHSKHHMKVDPYGPEPVDRRHGKSVTEAIEEINKKDKTHVLIEGDVIISSGTDKRVATNNKGNLWPGGLVPYVYDSDYPSSFKPVTEESMNILMEKTCLRFRPKQLGDPHAIKFFKYLGCYSYVGLQSDTAEQEISIGDGCDYTDTIIHEIMHAIGFWHEQNRPDRDDYLNIRMENVELGQEHNFKKRTTAESVVFKPYDYLSLMQYGNTDFSKNGMNTMEAKYDPNMQLGQTIGDGTLTASDIAEINTLYSCSGFVTNGNWGAWSAASLCSVSCGPGTATRTRQCNNPAPSFGGSPCSGDSTMQEACNIGACVATNGGSVCSFEDGMCGWKSTKSADNELLKWEITTGKTPSTGTGPDNDVTLGTERGHYVFLETSGSFFGYPVYGALKSPEISPSGKGSKRCLSYEVHMFGEAMGSLEVILLNLVTGAQTVLRKHKGNQQNQWYHNELTVDISSHVQIIFKGIRGHSWQGDIALDDIALSYSACASGPHDCDFEASTCFWEVTSLAYYPLLLNTGSTPSDQYTGPLSAHSGNGYIFADGYSEDAWPDDESSITSALIEMPSSGSICLSFWYHMDGDDIGTLSVNAVTQAGSHIMYQTSANGGFRWLKQRITIMLTDAIKVKIKVRRGTSTYGDIGLDDVKIRDGNC